MPRVLRDGPRHRKVDALAEREPVHPLQQQGEAQAKLELDDDRRLVAAAGNEVAAAHLSLDRRSLAFRGTLSPADTAPFRTAAQRAWRVMSRRLPWAAQEAKFLVAAKPLAPVLAMRRGKLRASGFGIRGRRRRDRGRSNARAGLEGTREKLAAADLPRPVPGPGEVLVAVQGVRGLPHRPARRRRRADRSETAAGAGARDRRHRHRDRAGVDRFAIGDRVGVPWLGWTCGVCDYCRAGRENLCDRARFTGYQIDGGYAELTVADQRYCFAIDPRIRRRRGGAVAVRRADRLPHLAAGRGRASGSASTASAPPRISWRRSRAIRAGGSSPSPGRATRRRRISRAGSARSGPAVRTSRRPSRSTPR